MREKEERRGREEGERRGRKIEGRREALCISIRTIKATLPTIVC